MNNVMTDENGKLQRDYWNILKGIGAFCVVLGHCAMPVQNFVYLFHVPLFFLSQAICIMSKNTGMPHMIISKGV